MQIPSHQLPDSFSLVYIQRPTSTGGCGHQATAVKRIMYFSLVSALPVGMIRYIVPASNNNDPITMYCVTPDVRYLRFRIKSIHIWLVTTRKEGRYKVEELASERVILIMLSRQLLLTRTPAVDPFTLPGPKNFYSLVRPRKVSGLNFHTFSGEGAPPQTPPPLCLGLRPRFGLRPQFSSASRSRFVHP